MNTNYGILRKIAKSKAIKGVSVALALEMVIQSVNPLFVMALTTGPSQPEVQGFKPIEITQMVDPFTGDFSYNIPLLDIGGYPLNLTYQSGVTQEDEASWVGLGWNVHTGAISRQMRGLPDDFWDDELTKTVQMRDNLTVGAKVDIEWEIFGYQVSQAMGNAGVSLSVGTDIRYNSYQGIGITNSTGAGFGPSGESSKFPLNAKLDFSAGPDGLDISPSISFQGMLKDEGSKLGTGAGGSLGFGLHMNSRQGLTGMSFSYSAKGSTDYFGQGYKGSSFIHFGQPTYTPQIDFPMTTSAGSGRFKLGGALYGQDFDIAIKGYGAKQKLTDQTLKNPSYGYMYAEKAGGNPNAIHDFNREKDGTFSKETNNLPLTNFTYDIFQISAQGLSGSFRPHRDDAGYVYDNQTLSPSTTLDFGVELDGGNLVDFGVDFTGNFLDSKSGPWQESNGAGPKLKFRAKEPNSLKESFHFKMMGESNVNSDPGFNAELQDEKPVRFGISAHSTDFEAPALPIFVDKENHSADFDSPGRSNRQNRNTAIYHYTKQELLRAEPWKAKYVSPDAQDHHIAQIVVVQPDGKRYVFGLAAYNTVKKEITFNVGEGGPDPVLTGNNSAATGLINYSGQASVGLGKKRGLSYYYEEVETKPYAHSWMLTEVLSADYTDLTGNGPTADDLGQYVKFNYGLLDDGQTVPNVQGFKWRTPVATGGNAAFMEGLKSDPRDDKANIVYGEKDVWYTHSIESKNQIAVFETSPRTDALGANLDGSIDLSKQLSQLDKIKMYSIQEYAADPVAAVPLKTVHFIYKPSGKLCSGVPNSTGDGKLTLDQVFFTYQNSNEGRFSAYRFEYNTGSANSYGFGQVDNWGIKKPGNQLPTTALNHTEYPYPVQDRTLRDEYSAIFQLRQITLPSGGKINVEYESDSYAYVQDRSAMRMFRVLGLAKEPNGPMKPNIYSDFGMAGMRDYLLVDLGEPSNTHDFRSKYLQGYGAGAEAFEANPLKKLYFRFMMNVNNGVEAMSDPDFEYISGYVDIENINDCGIRDDNPSVAYIKIKRVGAKFGGINQQVSPFAFAAWQFSRIFTPKKAFNQPEYGDPDVIAFIKAITTADILTQLINFFKGPNGRMLQEGFGNRMDPARSWIRLLEPDRCKLGGGSRVKKLTVSDGWDSMSPSESAANYGQEFVYEDPSGMSFGVAAYEPGTGADENPMRMPSFYNGPKQLLIPQEKFYMEEPFGESFFPGPAVGYAKVVVRNLSFDPQVTLNRTGKTEYEFYTARDFPVRCDQTKIKPEPRKSNILGQLFKVNFRNYMTASQGYSIVVNDMHGKPKAERTFAENNPEALSYIEYHYKTTDGMLDNKANVVYRDGHIDTETIGSEIDFVADMREQATHSKVVNAEVNLAISLTGYLPIPIVPSVYGGFSQEKTRFRSAVVTKVVSQYGIQDKVIASDKGAKVTTLVEAFDALTGEAIVRKINNEFEDNYYSLDYPAHWAYSGMRQASENIGYVFAHQGPYALDNSENALEPGDEVLMLGQKVFGRGGSAFELNANTSRLWVSKDEVSGELWLVNAFGEKYVVDDDEAEYFQIIRSGHRNMQSMPIAAATSQVSPVFDDNGHLAVKLDGTSRVITSSAMEYAEQWRTNYNMPKPPKQKIRISYDAPGFAFINTMNQAIAANGGTIPFYPNSVTIPADEYFHSLYPYGDCNAIQSALILFGEACNNYNLQVTYDNQHLYVPHEVIQTGQYYSYAVPVISAPNGSCHCDVQFLVDLSAPCTGGVSPGNWSDIAYFKTQGEVDIIVDGNPNTFINSNFWDYYYIIVAVLNDNTEIPILANKECWGLDNEFEVIEVPAKDCYALGDVVNPYLYGILGNWRPKTDYYFIGDRNNTDPGSTENLRTDGYLPGFKSFWVPGTPAWIRNAAVNLSTYENWTQKNIMTLYSPYGVDVENKNLLPSYSSASYGYNNILPLATAGNAMYKEMGYDGFEDYYPNIPLPQPYCLSHHFKFESYRDQLSSEEAHTGIYSLKIAAGNKLEKVVKITDSDPIRTAHPIPYALETADLLPTFSPNSGVTKQYVMSFWVRHASRNHNLFSYDDVEPVVLLGTGTLPLSVKKSKIINDWQQIEVVFTLSGSPAGTDLTLRIVNDASQNIFIDDLRIHPFEANMKSFVYNAANNRYMAQLDENNFATLYEYDEEGRLVRVKKETERGIATIQENQSHLYKR